MTYTIKRFAVAAASAGILLVSATGVSFAATVEGNGAGSFNVVSVSDDCLSSVYQSNTTTTNVGVSSVANTGGNEVSYNTGGISTVGTGSAASHVTVSVLGGSNVATTPSCCDCASVPSDAAVKNNGAHSKNVVGVSNTRTQLAEQRSKTKVSTLVTSKSSTGNNTAKKNTGSGAAVATGTSLSTVEVAVAGGSNVLE